MGYRGHTPPAGRLVGRHHAPDVVSSPLMLLFTIRNVDNCSANI